ncbi:hypothetical protein GGS26DRAFT_31526 [Hypomontagnella submonticulosa]|nr:hypothetical protein GGS26DRAFT_31526 [Hypomontagnella submonticulosa]
MAPRHIIADSDDEDEVDKPLSPPREDMIDPPEIEPLSPHHRPSSPSLPDDHNRASNSTDQSFFAGVYGEQQSRAIQQSQLIEHIVRQSQKASKSSGDVSLPAKSKGKKANASSATNITSPEVARKPGNQPSLFTDGTSSITTPRKSARGEWDVPSSAEGPTTLWSAKTSSSKGKNNKSYGKRRQSLSNVFGSPTAADIFTRDDDTAPEPDMRNEKPATIHLVDPFPQPGSDRRKISLPSSVLQDAPAPTNFYIAQSNLTTMQKLEYQKVHVPQVGYPGLPGSAANQKSSGMTTIAYSTPSRYASSSGPPLPWERASPDIETDKNTAVLDIPSSPDVIAGGPNYTEMTMANVHTNTEAVQNEPQALNKDDKRGGSSGKKRKKRARDTQDEDELVRGEYLGPETAADQRPVNHKRRRNERVPDSPRPHEDDDDIELIQNPSEEAVLRAECEEIPKVGTDGANKPTPELPTTEPLSPIDAFGQLETEVTPQPKKRGRKKKQQPASVQAIEDEQPFENKTTSDVQAEPEKPKKKRGRPRKSDPAKSGTGVIPESEVVPVSEAHGVDDQPDELSPKEAEVAKKPRLKKRQHAQKQEEHEESNDRGLDKTRDTSPLKEISANPKTPSQKSMSTEGPLAESVSKPTANQSSVPKRQEKASPKPKPTPTSSQPKVPYRVGLSKRTRITSLLKSIKR